VTAAAPGEAALAVPIGQLDRAPGAVPAGQNTAGRVRRWRRVDALVVAGYLLLALCTTARLWAYPGNYAVRAFPHDESLIEWLLAHGARLFVHPENPFFSTSINFPEGANLMANASILGIAVPLAPVTLLFGAHVSFIVVIVVGLAGTAAAWYVVLSRHLIRGRAGAFVGGLVIGFGPAAISHAAGQVHIITNFVLPFIVWRVLHIRANPRPVRNGVVLGFLVAYQVFLGEEMLFITGITMALVLVCYGVARPSEVRRHWRAFAANLLIGAVVAGVLVGYPLWFQFAGPQHWHGLMEFARQGGEPVDSFVTLSSQSLAGNPATPSTTDGIGLSLVVVLALVVVRFWRDPWIRAFAVSAVVLAALTLGQSVHLSNQDTGIPGPYRIVGHLPLFDAVTPGRLRMAVLALSGIILAAASDRIAGPVSRKDLRLGWVAALAAAVVPILPTPLMVAARPATPAFLADGTWRRYIDDKHSLVTFPLTVWDFPDAQRWVADTNIDVPLANGYVLTPTSRTNLTAAYSPADRPTTILVNAAARANTAPMVTDADRQAAVADLRYWHAAVVLVQPGAFEATMRQTAEQLLGPGEFVDGVWIWDVRAITSPG
jgi:hypothetical protein